MPKLALARLSTICLYIPNLLSEQREIVKRFDILSEQTKLMEEIYKKKLVLFEDLRKSILNKAFTGDL